MIIIFCIACFLLGLVLGFFLTVWMLNFLISEGNMIVEFIEEEEKSN